MKKEFLPGWIAMAALAWLAMFAKDAIGEPLMEMMGTAHNPVETAVLAIIVGVLLRNLKLIPAFLDAGIKPFILGLIGSVIVAGVSLALIMGLKLYAL